jgi:hypothetical protein
MIPPRAAATLKLRKQPGNDPTLAALERCGTNQNTCTIESWDQFDRDDMAGALCM